MERCANGTQLRPYQLRGVQWLTQCLKKYTGCILGDEMGLGKTCQTLSLLAYMSEDRWKKGPFLVLSPLSVMENWRKELERFAPSLAVLCYQGDKERRAEIQSQMNPETFQVLLTSYEICLKDAEVLKRWRWKALVVDEAHRLKNQSSVLHRTLKQFSVSFRILLTGTPIQNNLEELYSLLTFIQPSNFPAQKTEAFVNTYSNVENDPALAAELQCVLEPFLLRRVKSQVALDLPKKMELVMFHGLSALQKKYYKALLMKDPEAFSENAKDSQNRLGNILMNLRKCVAHPYLFKGVEPEPFTTGEHLIEASGKLSLIDNILAHLHRGGHRVLLFSQMTRMLDILQDYMDYRGYTYERLDGSVQGQRRNLAVDNFSSNEIFAFLLSTKAGGVGLNLIAADTVIFVDTDFNPQNDLQASARCHRIGQNKPVKVIRLLARHTVEEITYSRAVSKLRLTKAVIEGGRFALQDQSQSGVTALELSEILMFGVDKLLSSEESSVKDVKLEKILGRSRNGHWVDVEDLASLKEEEEYSSSDSEIDHIYYFEGKDYSRKPSRRDSNTFNHMVKEKTNEVRSTAVRGRGSRDDAEPSTSQAAGTSRKRRTLAEDCQSPPQNGTTQTRAKRDRAEEDGKKKTLKHKYKTK